jgi:hypothetical protein
VAVVLVVIVPWRRRTSPWPGGAVVVLVVAWHVYL